MMRAGLFVLSLLAGLVVSESRKAQLVDEDGDVLLKLDYATYRGNYDDKNAVYTFKNIRFAAPPLGELRWAKPILPPQTTEIQDMQDARACTQPPSSEVKTWAGAEVGGGHEDCLFLDLTIPRRVYENPSVRVPVLHWIHGGYYTQGSKDERAFHMFSKLSGGNIISVAANYRIGMYGFLGGPSVEAQGVPNVGLWDQRAALEWVQKYIGDIGGDPQKVTAMGISAGAGSILHHLTAEGGEKDPLFQRALFQSSGYDTVMDKQRPETKFKKIEEFAGCQGKGLACLRALSEAEMLKVSQFSNTGNRKGSSGWDPVPDGKYVVNTPVIEIGKGRYWKKMHGIINGYAQNEAGGRWFVDPSINSSAKFEEYVRNGFSRPGIDSDKLIQRLNKLYPAPDTPGSPFKSTADRMAAYVGDAGFNCHHRAIALAYPENTYSYQTSFFNGTHYMDQFPSFFDPSGPSMYRFLLNIFNSVPGLQGFQSYLVSFIQTGNPNDSRNERTTIEWPATAGFDGPTLTNVLNFTLPVGPIGFQVITSDRLRKETCDFWNDVWSA